MNVPAQHNIEFFFSSYQMAVMASGMLATAAVLLAASTAGQARSVRERRSAASDCSRAEVESSANGQQHIDYDDFCRIPNNASCRLRLNGTRIALSGADGGRNREGSSRMRAPADRSRNGRQDINYNIIFNISSIANRSLCIAISRCIPSYLAIS